ncbi:Dol-P-Man:Man(7)GlcNAc(2)-PP-Dol alpha-1 6-mannosyltransferase, partial [Bienertia sinuspersici]
TRSVALSKAIICCVAAAILSIGLTVMVDSIMWRRLLWPEFEVSGLTPCKIGALNGVSPVHWYFTSALPRSLLVAYPLAMLGPLLDRRILPYLLPTLSFVILYSKLPHKELRFIISSLPVFNLTAAISASRILGCTIMFFMASYHNYPSGYALRKLHGMGKLNNTDEIWTHIDTYSAMNGITRFCECGAPWRYSKEEDIALEEYYHRNFTYLLNEHSHIDGYRCLFAVDGFSRVNLRNSIPPVVLVKEPKVYVHGSTINMKVVGKTFPGC